MASRKIQRMVDKLPKSEGWEKLELFIQAVADEYEMIDQRTFRGLIAVTFGPSINTVRHYENLMVGLGWVMEKGRLYAVRYPGKHGVEEKKEVGKLDDY